MQDGAEDGGRRVLLVEDEFLVALEIERILTALGFDVVGPLAHVEEALEAASQEELCGALLDVNIQGGKILPVIQVLKRRGIPFILSTGYDEDALSREDAEAPRLSKPYSDEEAAALIGRTFPGTRAL